MSMELCKVSCGYPTSNYVVHRYNVERLSHSLTDSLHMHELEYNYRFDINITDCYADHVRGYRAPLDSIFFI